MPTRMGTTVPAESSTVRTVCAVPIHQRRVLPTNHSSLCYGRLSPTELQPVAVQCTALSHHKSATPVLWTAQSQHSREVLYSLCLSSSSPFPSGVRGSGRRSQGRLEGCPLAPAPQVPSLSRLPNGRTGARAEWRSRRPARGRARARPPWTSPGRPSPPPAPNVPSLRRTSGTRPSRPLPPCLIMRCISKSRSSLSSKILPWGASHPPGAPPAPRAGPPPPLPLLPPGLPQPLQLPWHAARSWGPAVLSCVMLRSGRCSCRKSRAAWETPLQRRTLSFWREGQPGPRARMPASGERACRPRRRGGGRLGQEAAMTFISASAHGQRGAQREALQPRAVARQGLHATHGARVPHQHHFLPPPQGRHPTQNSTTQQR